MKNLKTLTISGLISILLLVGNNLEIVNAQSSSDWGTDCIISDCGTSTNGDWGTDCLISDCGNPTTPTIPFTPSEPTGNLLILDTGTGSSGYGSGYGVGYGASVGYGLGTSYGGYGGYSSYSTPTVYGGYNSSSYSTPKVYGGIGSSSYNTPSSSWYSNTSTNNGNTSIYDNSQHNTYDNRQSSTYTDNSFCNGSNNCNSTHTSIVSNSTDINGNYNNVNTSSGGTSAHSSGSLAINCSTGYTAQNGNCVQNAVYTPTPYYNNTCTNGYHMVGNTCYPDVRYVNTPTCSSGYYLNGNSCYPYNNNYNNNNVYVSTPNYIYNNNNNFVNSPLPMVHISASPTMVNSGGYTTLSWVANNASYCNASGDWSGTPSLVGSRVVNNLTRTMTFNIACYNASGQSANDSVIVGVIGMSTGYVAPYNRAVTSLATHVTDISAVCNGMSISNNNLANTGYFEVREYNNISQITRSFNTNSANIGSNNTNAYAVPISGLKNHTRYTCRAIVNNQTGTLKGEETSFTTGSTARSISSYVHTNYVKSNIKTKIKNMVVCSDNSGNKMSVDSDQDTQMLELSVNKISSDMKVGEISYFSITIKNKGGIDINNVKVNLSLDKGVTLVNSNDWSIDRSTYNTFTNSINTLYKGSEKTYIVKQSINKDNIITSTIANVLATYEINTNKGVMSNEASAYAVYQVAKNEEIKVSEAPVVVKSNKSQTLGQYIDTLSLIEIIAIMGIIALIVFCIYNIYKITIEKKRQKRSIHTITEEYKH